MLAIPPLLVGLSAVFYVNGASLSASRHQTDALLYRRQTPNFDGDTPDFGSCNTTCAPLVSKQTACNFAGGLTDDSAGFACICTNDYIDAMATCVNCLTPTISAEDLEQFHESVEVVVEACNESGHVVHNATLTSGASSAGASQMSAPGNTSAIASGATTPTASGGASPSNAASPNSTQHSPNGAVGMLVPHVTAVVAGTFGVAAIAAFWC